MGKKTKRIPETHILSSQNWSLSASFRMINSLKPITVRPA